MRSVLLLALDVLERGLDWLSLAQDRVAMRKFLKDHPDVTVHPWTDGT
jgi:hypothetical protein